MTEATSPVPAERAAPPAGSPPPSALRDYVAEIGIPRVLIAVFLAALFAVALVKRMDVPGLLTDSLDRCGRNALLVLALLPGVRGGIGLNFGLPLGILCGLVGCIVSLDQGLTGLPAIAAAAAVGIALSVPVGGGYGYVLNRARGQEMMVGTYLGFASVSAMSIFWLLAPFDDPKLVLPIGGTGLRTTLTLTGAYEKVLDRLWSFTVAGVRVPTGSFAAFAAVAGLVALFFRTRAGIAMSAARSNPRFARAAGISDARTRVQATILSTAIAAVGIVVFAQSYGFIQLYTAPLLMAFPAVASLLIGGASVSRATMTHVVLGTLLFQSILTVALPVTSSLVKGDISETARLIIQNGMILYALTRKGER